MTTTTGLLVPRSDEESEAFWEGTAAGELRMQACTACGRFRFPPRPMCPFCHSRGREWRPVSGRGHIWSFVVPHPPLLSGYSELAPYAVVVVELEEDPTLRLVGNVVTSADGAINEVDPATVEIGQPVHAVFALREDEDGRTVFLPEWVRTAA